jgi:hypothetical protein
VNTGAGYRRSFVGAGKVTSERATVEITWGRGRGLNLFSGAEYDLFLGRISTARLQVRYDADRFAATVEAFRYAPTFSAYSLWSYFATAPRDEVRVRGDLLPPGPLRFYAQLLGAMYGATTNESLGVNIFNHNEEAGTPLVLGAGGGGQYANADGRHAGLDVSWRNGWGGRQLWLDLTAGFLGPSRRWTVDGRVSVASVKDAENPFLQGEFFGAQLWGSLLLSPGARASVVVEHNVNPFTRADTRASMVLDLGASL